MSHNHEATLAAVRADLPADALLCKLGNFFKVFGDPTRIKILYSLFESELCVCAIAELLEMEQSAISHQLKVLKDANLVCSRREGKTVFYSLADDHVNLIIAQGFNHITEGERTVRKKFMMEDLDCAHCAACCGVIKVSHVVTSVFIRTKKCSLFFEKDTVIELNLIKITSINTFFCL